MNQLESVRESGCKQNFFCFIIRAFGQHYGSNESPKRASMQVKIAGIVVETLMAYKWVRKLQ